MRKFIPAIVCLALLVTSISMTGAQTTTTATATPSTTTNTTTTTAGSESNVTIFFVVCQDAVVMNLSGQIEAGYDVYYQVYSGAGGTGTAITNLRQVEVNGAYTFSERLPFNSGATVAAGATASARVVMARETNAASTIYETTVDDLQDGCNNPQNALGTSIDAGTSTGGSEPATGLIRSPFGGYINNNFNLQPTPEPIVVIGARRDTTGRSDTPGVIFAECNQNLPEAAPGVLYDTDGITIFWSWYARTQAQVQDHILNADYNITFQTAPLGPVQVSPIEQRGVNYWVFYTVPIGRLTPGQYGIEFRLRWKQPITDGYSDFGPGTDNVEQYSNCTFIIRPNPQGQNVTNFNGMYSLPK